MLRTSSRPLYPLIFTVLTTASLACDDLGGIGNTQSDANLAGMAFDVLGQETVLQTDVGDVLAGQVLSATLQPSSHPVSVTNTTVDDIVGALLGNAFDKYGAVLGNGADLDALEAKMVGAVETEATERLTALINDNWSAMQFGDANYEVEITGCNAFVDYYVGIVSVPGMSAEITSVTFDVQPNDDRVRAHVVMNNVTTAPTMYVDWGASLCYGSWVHFAWGDGNSVVPINLSSLTFDVDLILTNDTACLESGCCEPVVAAELEVSNFVVGAVSKTLPKFEGDLGWTLDFDDYISDGMVQDLLNDALSGQSMSTSTSLAFGPMRITEVAIDDDAVDFTHEFDADGDGLFAACDVCTDSASNSDIDGDGVCKDNCSLVPNPDQADSDGDGWGNACDACAGYAGDNDPPCYGSFCFGDGIDDACDNCVGLANSDQTDTDDDGLGDACDDDDDDDGLNDDVDNCPLHASQNTSDGDGDGVGDICDNCAKTPNPGQGNADGDALGNACDPDIDGDGVLNGADNCEWNANAGQKDSDNDGTGDACDPDPDCDPDNPLHFAAGQCDGVPNLESLILAGLPIMEFCIGTGCYELELAAIEMLSQILVSRTATNQQVIDGVYKLGAYAPHSLLANRALRDALRSRRTGVAGAARTALTWQRFGGVKAMLDPAYGVAAQRQMAASRSLLPISAGVTQQAAELRVRAGASPHINGAALDRAIRQATGQGSVTTHSAARRTR